MSVPGPTPASDLTALRPFSADDLQAIRHILSFLNNLPGLLDIAFGYVVTGAGAGVLASLERELMRRDVDWVSRHSRLDAAERILLGPTGWDPDVVRRLGEVLALILHHRGHRRLPPGPAPIFFRALAWLTEETAMHRPADPAGWMLNGPRCLQLLAPAGMTQAGLFALLYRPFEAGADDWVCLEELTRMHGLDAVLRAAPERTLQGARLLSSSMGHRGIERLEAAGFGAYSCFQDFLYETAFETPLLIDAAVAAFLRIPGGLVLLEQRLQREQPGKRRRIEWSLHRHALRWGAEVPATDEPDSYRAMSGYWIDLPPLERRPPDRAPPAGLEEELDTAVREARRLELHIHEAQVQAHALRQARWPGGSPAPADPQVYTAEQVRGFMDLLTGTLAPSQTPEAVRQLIGREKPPGEYWRADALYEQHLEALLSDPGVTAHQLARLLAARGGVRALLTGTTVAARLLRRMARAIGDLRPILACFEGAADGDLLRHLLESEPLPRALGDPPLWWVIAAHLPQIDQALGLAPAVGGSRLNLLSALELLAMLPSPPARYFDVLVNLAARGDEAPGRPARALLATSGDLPALIMSFLRSPDPHRRLSAALWMRERDTREAIPELRAALDAEADGTVRSALLSTLAALGERVIDALRTPRVVAEARAQLTAHPDMLVALPLPLPLPALTWNDGQPVAPELALTWTVHAVHLRDPRGDARLHLWLDHLDPGSAGGLGMLALRTFLDNDRVSEAQASAYAGSQAPALVRLLHGWGRTDFTHDAAFNLLRRQRLERPKSTLHNRGILALMRRAPAEAVQVVRAGMDGGRLPASQRKEILAALATHRPVPSPLILAFLHETATEHRRRGYQQQAQRALQSLGRAHGWSDEALADRAMPRAGLDASGRLTLPGTGGATARLGPYLTILIEDTQGRVLPRLPTGCAAAREALAQLRRDVKKIAARQSTRLEQAMIHGRIWRVDDLREILLAHPITGRLCQHLIFAALDGDARVLCPFRPTDEGSFIDALGDPVSLDAASGVRLVHRWLLDPAQLHSWMEHIGDFRLVPAFSQLQ